MNTSGVVKKIKTAKSKIMNNLIPIVNKLQDVFNIIGINTLELPQIVTMGTQSSGKSSIIENIVGYDFLPRGIIDMVIIGCGMVTRRPLILQLICNKNEQELTCELQNKNSTPNLSTEKIYAKFHHSDKIFINFKDVHDEIIDETNRAVPDEKDVSSDPIILKIFSPDLVNLTLVDLPGLTRIPIGKQPIDIEEKISKMTLNYISNKNSIILAVVPANIDIATSEALRVASIVDPKGERTIACLTKLDLMDKGTNAHELLTGKGWFFINVRLGIIGVVNRSQMDLKNNKPILKALEYEDHFFRHNYPQISQRAGTKYLVNVLNKILLLHIHKCLPELNKRVRELLDKFSVLNNNLGGPLPLEDKLNKISCGGSRIYYIYHELFGKIIESIDPLDGLEEKDIVTVIRNSKGMKTSLFIPEDAFEFLVKKQIKKLEIPSLDCVSLVREEMVRIISQSQEQIPEFYRFPKLKEYICEIVKEILCAQNEPTCSMIKSLILSELAYINTNHPDFVHIASKISQKIQDNDTSSFFPQSAQMYANNVETALTNDFKTNHDHELGDHFNKREIFDSNLLSRNIEYKLSVPKFITYFLIEKTLDRLPNELIDKLLTDELVNELLTESIDIKNEREINYQMIQALTTAKRLIKEVKETQI
ncbi:hypothetical protein HZS_684 [Henneguya salminicola]|nr:hypothetical protein HZS_684 [Henneguya salminicola]